MAIVHRLAVGTVCLLMLVPSIVSALELGAIEARSVLYEPLDARIPIRGAGSGDIEGLKIVLGSPVQFELAGVERFQHLDLLEFIVVEQGGGSGYIHVRTDEPIIEPSLTFLIDVDWPRGRLVRGYSLRFKPEADSTAGAPRNRSTVPAAEQVPETTATASTTATATTTSTSASTTASTSTSASPPATPASSASGVVDYGPIQALETLWSIASRFRPDDSVSVQRMMLAILDANPEAFEFRNVNALNAGATLRIPTRDEIGPDDREAAIAEIRRQHSAWALHREEMGAAPDASAAAPEPGGRIEVVSPETTTNAAERERNADLDALRRELALSMEDADAARRENDELSQRLAGVEEHVKELSRLIDLKNEEIAALQSELRAIGEKEPGPAPASMETEPKQDPASVDEESEPSVTPAGSEAGQVPAQADEESKPSVTPAGSEAGQVPAQADEESKPSADPAGSEAGQVPAQADEESKPSVAPAEPETGLIPTQVDEELKLAAASVEAVLKSLPFGLGALPVNPVFLVGGAGLLLILLGILALLRRRRTSAGEDDILEAADDPVPPDENNFLVELEAVAAELADEADDPPDRQSRSTPAAVAAAAHAGMGSGPAKSDAADSWPDNLTTERLTEERVAALWPDDESTERDFSSESGADDDRSGTASDIHASSRGDSGSIRPADETGDGFDLRDLADLVAEQETAPDGSDRGAARDLDPRFSRHEAGATDSGAPAFAPATGAGGPPGPDSGILDDARDDARPVTPDDAVSVVSESGPGDTMMEGADRDSVASADQSVEVVPGSDDDPGASRPTPHMRLDEHLADAGTGEYSLDDLGEDEVQTKIDLARVYMEMGDTGSARGFIEAVLAEGSPEQQDIARKMLSSLA